MNESSSPDLNNNESSTHNANYPYQIRSDLVMATTAQIDTTSEQEEEKANETRSSDEYYQEVSSEYCRLYDSTRYFYSYYSSPAYYYYPNMIGSTGFESSPTNWSYDFWQHQQTANPYYASSPVDHHFNGILSLFYF